MKSSLEQAMDSGVPQTFADVLRQAGDKPITSSQHESRHYSETLSKGIAHWLRGLLMKDASNHQVLTPEAKVPTIYGRKSLDVAVLDKRGYLVLDLSVKTFNFKDRKTNNYRHNYTGRFYELLGEELDVRRSYKWVTLVAFIFLPVDSCIDTDPSSFAHAVRQFSKVLTRPDPHTGTPLFEHVFVAVHDPVGRLFFFDASQPAPRTGLPSAGLQLSAEAVVRIIQETVSSRAPFIATDELPDRTPSIWDDK